MPTTAPSPLPRVRALAAGLSLALGIASADAAAPALQRTSGLQAPLSVAGQWGRPGSDPRPRGGVTRAVQNCTDGGAGSLREAYLASGDGDLVDLRELACSTIALTSGELQSNGVVAYVAILGQGEPRFTIDANLAGRA